MGFPKLPNNFYERRNSEIIPERQDCYWISGKGKTIER